MSTSVHTPAPIQVIIDSTCQVCGETLPAKSIGLWTRGKSKNGRGYLTHLTCPTVNHSISI